MHRREYLAAIAASIVVTGCTTAIGANPDGTTSESPLTVDAPTVEPGGTGTITVRAASAARLRFTRVADADIVAYGDAEFSPSPDATYDMRPPTWVWSSPQSVSGEIPVRAPESVSPGSYGYTLEVRDGEDGVVTREFSVRVRE